MKKIMFLLKLIFCTYFGAEDEIEKLREENLATLDLLLKSKKTEDEDDEKMKDPEYRKKLKEKMKKFGNEDEEDEGEDEDEGEKQKMKKSKNFDIDDEIVDALPIINDLVKSLEKLSSKMDMLKSDFEFIKSTVDESSEINKSMASVVLDTATILKSTQKELDVIKSQPASLPKGINSPTSDMLKSGSGQQISNSQVKNILLKSAMDGDTKAGSFLTQFEMTTKLSDEAKQFVLSKIK
jgi:hypothetical protein